MKDKKDEQRNIPNAGDPLRIGDAAARLGWSYRTALRYFERIEGVCIKPGLKQRGRTKRTITIPENVFMREWTSLTTRISAVDVADERMRQFRLEKRIKKAA